MIIIIINIRRKQSLNSGSNKKVNKEKNETKYKNIINSGHFPLSIFKTHSSQLHHKMGKEGQGTFPPGN